MNDITETVTREHGRDRRKRETRQALRRATLELGLEHGLAAVSVEAITGRAGVSTRTFFNYFERKEEAALLPLFALADDDLRLLVDGPPASAWSDLTRLFIDDVERATAAGEDFLLLLELHQQNPVLAGRQLAVFAHFEAQVSAAVVERLGHGADADVRGPLMVGCCITAVRVALDRWARRDRRGSVRPHLERSLALVRPACAVT